MQWMALWWVPIFVIDLIFGNDQLAAIGYFFSQLAVVTFGGAYAVLAYMAQDVVGHLGWLQPGTMMDGLGLAESTPGPLILVTEFVGFITAFHTGGLAYGIAGALVASVGHLYSLFFMDFCWRALYRMADRPAATARRTGGHYGGCCWRHCQFIFVVCANILFTESDAYNNTGLFLCLFQTSRPPT